MSPELMHNLNVWFFPLYYLLYFAWPPFLIYWIGHRRKFLSRLITLWTLSGALTVLLTLSHLNTVSTLPAFGPEPYNTIILVTIRLALLVTLACLSLERHGAWQPVSVAKSS